MTNNDDTRPRWAPTELNIEMRKRYPRLAVWQEYRPPKVPMGESLNSLAEKLSHSSEDHTVPGDGDV